MNYLDDLKNRCDIVDVARQLNCLPSRRSGTRYQGGCCPAGHGSEGERCFCIWSEIQAFKCYHCGAKGDVIDLVKLTLGIDFPDATNWLADRYGIPWFASGDMSPQERATYKARQKERQAIFDVLTEAAHLYHETLMTDDEMLDHLRQHYGLTDDTITTYRLGYSIGRGLLKDLQGKGFSKDIITATGLFARVGEKLVEFFNHRFVFPYWKTGKVVYFIGRKTKRTFDKRWEEAKYKKLPGRSEVYPHISEFIKNRCLYGEDSTRGANTVFVAEGVTDCLAMLQAGLPTISPVTTRFRADDAPRLVKLTKKADAVYLVPDAEENQAGINGAMDTAKVLEDAGRRVFVVNLPRPDGVDKVDATDFLRNEGNEAFQHLVNEAKTPLQLEIDKLNRFTGFQLLQKLSPITNRLATLPEIELQTYLDYAKGALGLKGDMIKAIRQEVKKARQAGLEKEVGANVEGRYCARFPALVDLVLDTGNIRYLVNVSDELTIVEAWQADDGCTLIPPGRDAIPYELIPASLVPSPSGDNTVELYHTVINRLQDVSVLPSKAHYHLCTVYVFFTYLAEKAPYFPYLWLFGLPERGKSRLIKALIHLSWRGLYSETLNEAYIFRFADLFGGTLGLDVYEISERAQKKGSHDLLLGRYEKGVKVARVIAPDKGPFRDTLYFRVSGPTMIATNVEIPAKDPLRSRCIKIAMPEARGIYENNSAVEDLQDLRVQLLAFRARYMKEELPKVEKPVAGRLGDLMQPLLAVAKLLPPEATKNLRALINELEVERRETEAETLAGRIVENLASLQHEVISGRLPVEHVREKINEKVEEKWHVSPQRLGRELSALGIERKKVQGSMHIIWSPSLMEKIFARFNPIEDTSPNSPKSQNLVVYAKNQGEITNGISPDSPSDSGNGGDISGEIGEIQKESPCLESAPEEKMEDRGERGDCPTGNRETHILDNPDDEEKTNLREVTI